MLIVVSGYCWKSVLQWLLCAHVPVVYVKKIFCQRYIIVLFHIPIINKKICWHVNSTEWMNMMCSFLQDFKKRSRATNRHQNQNQRKVMVGFYSSFVLSHRQHLQFIAILQISFESPRNTFPLCYCALNWYCCVRKCFVTDWRIFTLTWPRV